MDRVFFFFFLSVNYEQVDVWKFCQLNILCEVLNMLCIDVGLEAQFFLIKKNSLFIYFLYIYIQTDHTN